MSREDSRRHQAELETLRRSVESRAHEAMRFTPKEIALLVIATVLAFGGLFADDTRIVFPCLIISWLAFMYLCGTPHGSLFWRAGIGIVITAAYAFVLVHVYSRGLERQQEDVYAKLTAQAVMPASHNVLRTGITVVNSGGTNIREHTIGCYLRRVVYSPYGGIMNGEMRTTLPDKSTLHAFGDGETSYCIAGIQAFPPDAHPLIVTFRPISRHLESTAARAATCAAQHRARVIKFPSVRRSGAS
jgi:hypothetical protein